MTTHSDLMSAFLTAAYGKLTPNLMTYSAELEGNEIHARIVVLEDVNDDELDTVYEILGDTVGHTGGTARFDLVRVPSVEEARLQAELPIKLYRASSLQASDF